MPRKEESAIQEKHQTVFKKHNSFVYKTHGDAFVRTGIPDLIACVPVNAERLKELINEDFFDNATIGLFVGIECKTPDKIDIMDYTRQAQEIVGKEIKDAGGIWFVSSDDALLDAILKYIKGDKDAV